MSKIKKIVNSWNEWDPLKHVIVGRADGVCIPAPEPALDAKVPEDSDMKGKFGPRTKDTVDKANQLLNDFTKILKKRGIKVDRPTPLDFNQKISTPDWKVETMFGCMPPRDVLLTIGNEILEATMSYRCRWFEYLCYRPLLEAYYNADPNMRHESAPKPRLTDADYRKDYLSEKIGVQKRLEWAEKKYFVTTEEEPLFDAADVLRFGKDLVGSNGFFIFLFFFHSVIGVFGIYRMKIRQTVENPDSQFVAMPQTITPAGIELNPLTEPIQEPSLTIESSKNIIQPSEQNKY